MKGSEFVRKLKWLGRKNGVSVKIEQQRGKGSHSTLFYGNQFTIIRNLKGRIENWNLPSNA